VHFIARGKHLQAMRGEGLRVEGPEPIHIPRVSATDDPREVGAVDFVMLCVKLWDTPIANRRLWAVSATSQRRSTDQGS
jgi:2-dehydropantoate 2-reductase